MVRLLDDEDRGDRLNFFVAPVSILGSGSQRNTPAKLVCRTTEPQCHSRTVPGSGATRYGVQRGKFRGLGNATFFAH